MMKKILSSAVAVTASAVALSIAPVATAGAATLAATNGDVHIGGIASVCPDPRECPGVRA